MNLYFTTPMTTAQVVRHLGYPTRQCLERWLARDPRYAGHMVKPIIPLETRTKAIELVPGSMQQKQVAELLGAGLGAVRNWVKAYREDGLTAQVPKRRGYGSYEGETTPAPGNLADRDFTVGMPNGKRLMDITRDQGPGREGRASRRRSTATAAGSSRTRPVGPNAGLADRMLVKAAETLPEGARPLAHSDRGCHCQWPGWLALMDHYGPALSTGAKGCSPDNAAAEGLSGRMKTESVHPGHWEERTRDEVLVPVDGCIRWYDHELFMVK